MYVGIPSDRDEQSMRCFRSSELPTVLAAAEIALSSSTGTATA
jgi:hypothetical protein